MKDDERLINIFKQLQGQLSTIKRRKLIDEIINLTIKGKDNGKMKNIQIKNIETVQRIIAKINQEKDKPDQEDLIGALTDLLQNKLVEIHKEIISPKFIKLDTGQFELENWDWDFGIDKKGEE